jgi:adhesin transport system membrane fusion protein
MRENLFAAETEQGSRHRLVLYCLVACLAVFWLWAVLAHIDLQVRGQGSIVPSGQAKVIQHLEGGVVATIMIVEGQQVEAGQALFQISNQQAESDSNELRLQALSQRLQILRLQAELDNQTTLDFGTLASQANATTIENERQLFQSRMRDYRSGINVLEEQVNQKQFKLEDLSTQYNNVSAELHVARDQHAINEKLRMAGAISETRYLQSKSVLQEFTTRLGSVEKGIPVVRAELEEVRKRINETQEKHKAEVIEDLKKAQLALGQLAERSKTPDDKIRRTTVTSPIRGVINRLYLNTVGGVVKSGDKLAEIIPLDDKLIVEGRVPTKDRGLIWNGLPVLVKISAYDYAVYGGIDGKLVDISADTLADEHGAPYYRVKVALAKNKMGEHLPLFPGMTAEINILSGKTSIWNALLRPLWRVRENALREAK